MIRIEISRSSYLGAQVDLYAHSPIYFSNTFRLGSRQRVYVTKSLTYRRQEQLLPPNLDYVRYATLGLCAEMISRSRTPGCVAELGVYRGDFAMRLNEVFKDRKLYLFDTFEGFDQRDVTRETGAGYSTGKQDFTDTSIELVRKKMPFPENCVFRQGYFPSTAAGIEERFCFVSLDADLFEPIYAGLDYFHPRMNEGGYIFVHDFNNDEYSGAAEAVRKYCSENGVCFVPIPDSGGSVVIAI